LFVCLFVFCVIFSYNTLFYHAKCNAYRIHWKFSNFLYNSTVKYLQWKHGKTSDYSQCALGQMGLFKTRTNDWTRAKPRTHPPQMIKCWQFGKFTKKSVLVANVFAANDKIMEIWKILSKQAS
jgi:hypothetical protein